MPRSWLRARPRATGEVVWVHADQATMRSTPLPAALLERLSERSQNRV
jgi:acyl-CoA thioesterase FadM